MGTNIAIIGAGISGVSMAHYMNMYRKAGLPVNISVFEAREEPGGCIRSVIRDGYMVESGPNGVLTSKAHFKDLYDSAGLSSILAYSSDLTNRRYIQLNNKLNLAPGGLGGAISTPLLPFKGKLRVLKEPFINSKAQGDESVYNFAARRLGKDMAENLISTLIGGIYAGDAHKLSVKSAFPWMYALEAQYGGLVKGMIGRMKAAKAAKKADPAQASKRRKRSKHSSKLLSSNKGMHGLVSALAEKCDGVQFHYGCAVDSIEKTDGTYKLHTSKGEFSADRVVSCCNAHDAARIFSSLDAEMAAAFAKVQFAPMFICGMGFDRRDVGHPLDGFGYLVAPKEGGSVLGTLFSSTLYNGRVPDGKVLLTAITVGDRGENRKLFAESDDVLEKMAYDRLKTVLSLRSAPEITMSFRTEHAIPQYYIGHSDIVNTIRQRAEALGGVYICGNTTNGISVSDCVLHSRNVSEQLYNDIK